MRRSAASSTRGNEFAAILARRGPRELCEEDAGEHRGDQRGRDAGHAARQMTSAATRPRRRRQDVIVAGMRTVETRRSPCSNDASAEVGVYCAIAAIVPPRACDVVKRPGLIVTVAR